MWCAPQPVGKHKDLQCEFTGLRGIVHHTVPGEYYPGTKVDSLLADLRNLPRQRHDGPTPRNAFPMDTINRVFPGADIAPIPAESWLKIDGNTHTTDNRMVRSDTIYPGNVLVVRAPPPGISVHGLLLPFLIGVAIETPRPWNVLMTWLWSGMCLASHLPRRSDLAPRRSSWTHSTRGQGQVYIH